MLKKLYRFGLHSLEKLPVQIERMKTWVAEWYAIIRKYPLYKNVKWSKDQQAEFDQYWKRIYGKKIPNYWHRLYQAISGSFCVEYCPEILYTTKIEASLNDRKYADALEDKSLLETLCVASGVKVPETIFLCSAGRLYDAERRTIDRFRAAELLSYAGEVVVKPTVGSSSGRGILFQKYTDKVDPAVIQELISTAGKEFIIQKRICPHMNYSVFNDTSINTVRITTYIADDEIHHVPLAFRIGRNGKNVDNIHAGGIGVGVMDDGMLLSKAYELGFGDKGKIHEAHPDSGVRFENHILYGVPEIIRAAHNLHGRFPHIGVISWEFTAAENGDILLIEANISGQGIWFPQIIHGKGAFGDNTTNILRLIRGIRYEKTQRRS